MKLDFISYLIYLHDAVIYNNLKTESGIEWLDNAWLLEQSSTDRHGLRENFRKK